MGASACRDQTTEQGESRERKSFYIRAKEFQVFAPCNNNSGIMAGFMCFQALDEALQTAQPLEASRETLHEVWKHQVSFGHHNGTIHLYFYVHACLFSC